MTWFELHRKRRMVASVAACVATLGLVAPSHADRPRRPITLLAITDFHGALSSGGQDRVTQRPWGGAIALGNAVRRARAAAPDRCFLFDAGDEMQGTPASNFDCGRPAVAILNRLGTDAAALGNHEFDWGVDTLAVRRSEMRYTLLAANVFERVSGKRPAWVQPWTIVQRDGVRLGVIGFATPETPTTTLPQNVAHLRFDPPEKLLPGLVRRVRRAGAQVVVVVGHIPGYQRQDGVIEGAVADLARAAPGVDAVIGGHSHTFVAGQVDGVPVVIAASSGRALGRIQLAWDGHRVRGAEVVLQTLWADSIVVMPGDPIAAFVDSIERAVAPRVSRVVGRAARPLGTEDLANYTTDAMRAASGADIAMTNPGGIRRDLPAGPITVGHVFEVLPFENVLVTMRLRGSELKRILGSKPDKVRLGGARGHATAARDAAAVQLEHADGTPLRDDSTYVFVTNNFIFGGGDGFTGFEVARDVQMTDLRLRDVVQQAMEEATREGRDVDPEPGRRFEAPSSR